MYRRSHPAPIASGSSDPRWTAGVTQSQAVSQIPRRSTLEWKAWQASVALLRGRGAHAWHGGSFSTSRTRVSGKGAVKGDAESLCCSFVLPRLTSTGPAQQEPPSCPCLSGVIWHSPEGVLSEWPSCWLGARTKEERRAVWSNILGHHVDRQLLSRSCTSRAQRQQQPSPPTTTHLVPLVLRDLGFSHRPRIALL